MSKMHIIVMTCLLTVACKKANPSVSFERMVIVDAMEQLEIVERTTKDPQQLCLRAQLVGEAILLAKEETYYANWMNTTVKRYCAPLGF